MRRTLILFFLLATTTLIAQLPDLSREFEGHLRSGRQFLEDSLDIYVEREMKAWNIPGVAVAVIKDGEVLVSKGFGVRKQGEAGKVDADTRFMIGSNTKAFTGMAMAMLAADGKWKLDDPVREYLPEFSVHDPWVSEHINLTDLVSHRMGYETFQGDFMYIDSDFDKDEVIKHFGKIEPMYAFRTQWGYTNAGYMVAAKCIESASGISWDNYLREHLIRPLDMRHTLLWTSEMPAAGNAAAPHTYDHDELVVIPYGGIDGIYAAGSISSTVNDMSHWVSALLDGGKYGGEQVIPKAAIAEAWTPRSVMSAPRHPFNRSHLRSYALGWMIQDYEGSRIVSHTGGVHGFVTSVTLLPDENLGIVVLTNTDQNGFYEALKWEIMDAMLGLPYRGYSALYRGGFEGQMVQKQAQYHSLEETALHYKAKKKEMKAYAGTYRHENYGTITITAEDDYLVLTFEHHPDLRASLRPLGEHRFLAEYNNPVWAWNELTFDTKGDMIKALPLYVADYIEFTPYRFVKE